MIEKINDGGPAFPTTDPNYERSYAGEGMTLRDYFAAKAMQAEIITSSSDATPKSTDALIEAAKEAGLTPEEQVAFNAYLWADAMLKARSS